MKSKDPIVNSVIEDLVKRSEVGLKKYGKTLNEEKSTLKQKLQHAYEECLDQANYLKWAILELDKNELSNNTKDN